MITLSADQQGALDAIHEFAIGKTPHGVATLSGFAGVGKTTVVAQLLFALSNAMGSLRILVTAPTHKALAVLAGKLGSQVCDAMTTQAALGLRLTELESGEHRLSKDGSPKLAEYDLAIIDEASMVSDDLFSAILASRRRCRVLFVGDPAQLAPVGSDSLSPAFDAGLVPLQVRLTEVVRQAVNHPSIRLSVVLRSMIEANTGPQLSELARQLVPEDDRFLEITSGGDALLRNWAVDAFRDRLDARILAFTNRACVAHNAAVHAALFPGSRGFAVGEQVIAQDGFVMRGKEEAIQVRTSELLTVVDIEPARHEASPDIPAWRVTLENESGRKGAVWVAQSRQKLDELISRLFSAWRCLKQAAENEDKATRQGSLAAAKAASQDAWALRNRYANLRHAYALTIHKSQGSTFDAVLIDWGSLPNNGGADASRLAYVAITRPSTYAVIVTP